jgi:ethanolamine transporter
MVGIYCLTPVISKILGPIIIPIYTVIGVDPAMFGSILANDIGGFPLSMELAQNQQAGLLSGAIVSSMLGCTLVFSIPVGLNLIEKKDEPFFFKGILIGLITIPFGSFIGGWIAGFDLILVVKNIIPVIILSVLLAAGLKLIPDKMIKGSIIMGRLITAVLYVGLASAAFEYITKIVIIPGMTPIMEVMKVVASIGIILLGTFPILSVAVMALDRPLNAIGRKIGMDAASTAGLVISMANSIPVYKMMKNMSARGKVVNTAWLVPATAALGDHLGFTAGIRPDMIAPVVLGKLSAGILAVILALMLTKEDSSIEN